MRHDAVFRALEEARDEMIDFASELVRIPTVNPPGEGYRECAEVLGRRLSSFGFDVELVAAAGRPEHTPQHPRLNVIGTRCGASPRPTTHLNGHIDVVPAGQGWTIDPFAGVVRDGKLFGRGSSDMKGGLAAAVYAAEALRRAGHPLKGTLEVSGTVDEESGGFAGVAWLCEKGFIGKDRTDFVIIPEPLDVDRIGIGHRGVYWFKVVSRGRMAHGSMPFLGSNAVEHMGALLEAFRTELQPALAEKSTSMPVVPERARRATLNVNSIAGGQTEAGIQTPCVPDRCVAVFDRRFLVEEGLETARGEVEALLARVAREDPDRHYELEELMVVHPVETPRDSPLIHALAQSIREVLGKDPALVASPGTYDHKHVTRIGGVRDCVAYGPGRLEAAHRSDEWCDVKDLVDSAHVLALTLLALDAR